MDIYKKEDGKIIVGKSVPAFICNGGVHFLTSIGIYQDGILDCWGKITFDEFKEKVASGWIKTSVKEGKDIYLTPLGKVKGGAFYQAVQEDEFIKEVSDIIEELNGRKTTSEICRAELKAYLDNQSEENREKLKIAYENIPEHLRRNVLEDMDLDDMPIRVILYGEEGVSEKIKFDIFRDKVNQFLSNK